MIIIIITADQSHRWLFDAVKPEVSGDHYLGGPHTERGLEESSSSTNLLPRCLQESSSLDKPPFTIERHTKFTPVQSVRLSSNPHAHLSFVIGTSSNARAYRGKKHTSAQNSYSVCATFFSFFKLPRRRTREKLLDETVLLAEVDKIEL